MLAPDRVLMESYASGDPDAAAALLDRFAPRIRAFFVRRCGDATRAEELTSATSRLVKKAHREYRIGFPPAVWVLTIAARVGRGCSHPPSLFDGVRRGRRSPSAAAATRPARAILVDRHPAGRPTCPLSPGERVFCRIIE